jgi:sensor domain DACNV-containing protein
MTEPAYLAARTVAAKVEAHFAQHAADARRRGAAAATLPDADTIEAIIDAAFWASLRREESYVPKISLAFLPPDAVTHPLLFERPLPLVPGALVKVAPAVERPGIHLGVWRDGQGLSVWGTVRAIPPLCLVVEVAAPGLLVVKHHRGDEATGKFVNVAVLEGDQIKIVDERASSLPDCPPLLTSLLGFESPASWVKDIGSVNVLVQLAVSMRAHARGGLLLVVPEGSQAWLESIVRPMPYAVVPAFAQLAELNRQAAEARDQRLWQDAINRAVEVVAGLTAVDGATVLTNQYELLAFGAKIARRKGSPQIEQVTVTEPVEGNVALTVHPTQIGGTRHLSAAQFVHDQRGAVALVASQDGRFTVFAWSACEEMVHAHRVETLLL